MGKHRKGGEGYARKMKERKKAGMEGKQETMRRREVNAGKQTAGERERESPCGTLLYSVLWCHYNTAAILVSPPAMS